MSVYRDRDDPPDTWIGKSRSRFYMGGAVFDGEDEKSWLKGTIVGTEEEVKEKNDTLARMILSLSREYAVSKRDAMGGEIFYLDVRGEGYEAFKSAVERDNPPWMHMKSVSADSNIGVMIKGGK